MEGKAARNTTKRSWKKTAPVVSKKKSKKSAEESVREHTVDATFQPPNLGNSADPVNASYNDAMEVEAANNTTKRSRKKLAPAVSKKKSKNASEGAIVENNVEATMQQLNLGNSTAGATFRCSRTYICHCHSSSIHCRRHIIVSSNKISSSRR